MARIYGITIPAGIEIIYNKAIKMYDIAVFCNIGRNPSLMPRSKKVRLKEITKLYQVAYKWASLTQAVKDAWYLSADVMGQNGYALYTQDKCYRLMNSLPDDAVPSIYHQFFVSHIKIQAPATNCLLSEFHLSPYSNPTTMSINYRCDFVDSGGVGSAKLRFTGTRLTGGQNIEDVFEIELWSLDEWINDSVNITIGQGVIANWKIQLICDNVEGNLYFDDIFVEYDATIQNNDPFCDNFPSTFSQDDVPAGVSLEAIYCPDAVS